MSAAKSYRRVEHAVGREIAGEYLLVPVMGELADLKAVFTLNPTGRCIWEALDEPRGREEVSAKLTERFEIDEETAGREFDEFVAVLVEEKLVTITDGTGGSGHGVR